MNKLSYVLLMLIVSVFILSASAPTQIFEVKVNYIKSDYPDSSKYPCGSLPGYSIWQQKVRIGLHNPNSFLVQAHYYILLSAPDGQKFKYNQTALIQPGSDYTDDRNYEIGCWMYSPGKLAYQIQILDTKRFGVDENAEREKAQREAREKEAREREAKQRELERQRALNAEREKIKQQDAERRQKELDAERRQKELDAARKEKEQAQQKTYQQRVEEERQERERALEEARQKEIERQQERERERQEREEKVEEGRIRQQEHIAQTLDSANQITEFMNTYGDPKTMSFSFGLGSSTYSGEASEIAASSFFGFYKIALLPMNLSKDVGMAMISETGYFMAGGTSTWFDYYNHMNRSYTTSYYEFLFDVGLDFLFNIPQTRLSFEILGGYFVGVVMAGTCTDPIKGTSVSLSPAGDGEYTGKITRVDSGFTLAANLHYWLSKNFSLMLGVRWLFGDSDIEVMMNAVQYKGSTQAMFFTVGFSFH